MGYNPDCVDRDMLDDGDGCPKGMLPSVPVCVVTNDMTYQEKIDAPSGMTMMMFVTIYRTILTTMNQMIGRSCLL